MALSEGRTKNRLGVLRDEELDVQFMRTLSSMSEGGAELGECLSVATEARRDGLTGYTRGFATAGERLQQQAEERLARADRDGARRCYLRASNYFRAAMGLTDPHDPAHRSRWQRSRGCFTQAALLATHPFEPLEVPFDGGTLPCWWLRPAADERPRPTLFVTTGGEGTAMEMYFWVGQEAVRRGYNVLLYEGPINVSALLGSGLRFSADCERPISAVIDRLEQLPGSDRAGLSIIGFSFGGYLAARAAALEPRIKALIADSPLRDPWGLFTAAMPRWLTRPVLLRRVDLLLPLVLSRTDRVVFELAQMEFGVSSMFEWLERLKPLGLQGLESRIVVPTLSLCGEDEGEHFLEQARAFHEHISAEDKTLRCFTREEGASAHCQLDNPGAMRTAVFDWLGARFHPRPARALEA